VGTGARRTMRGRRWLEERTFDHRLRTKTDNTAFWTPHRFCPGLRRCIMALRFTKHGTIQIQDPLESWRSGWVAGFWHAWHSFTRELLLHQTGLRRFIAIIHRRFERFSQHACLGFEHTFLRALLSVAGMAYGMVRRMGPLARYRDWNCCTLGVRFW